MDREPPRRYTYRIVFIPETIGSLAYLSAHLDELQAQRVVAGFNVTCVGDDRAYSYLPSRDGGTLADRVALNVLRAGIRTSSATRTSTAAATSASTAARGSTCPSASVMRSKYHEYPEYHTSLDDLTSSRPPGCRAASPSCATASSSWRATGSTAPTCLGEPQLGRRGLYPTLGTTDSHREVGDLLDLLAYADGTQDLIGISDVSASRSARLYPLVDRLVAEGLLVEVSTSG